MTAEQTGAGEGVALGGDGRNASTRGDGLGTPPITEIAVATLAVIVAGGIYLAASMPGRVTLAPAVALLGVGAVLLVVNAALLSRTRDFAWRRFATVFRWVLVAYLIVAGMLEYVFLYDGVSGGTLAILSGMLAVFALNVPLVVSFTVASFVGEG
jgi:hypothetical protein